MEIIYNLIVFFCYEGRFSIEFDYATNSVFRQDPQTKSSKLCWDQAFDLQDFNLQIDR